MSNQPSCNQLNEKVSLNWLTQLKNFLRLHQQIIPYFLMMVILALPINLFIIKQVINQFFANQHHYKTLQNAPIVTAKKLMDGSLQKEYETWFNDRNPLKSMFTKFNNQFYYSLFSKSLMYNTNIIVGKKGYLYEKMYVDQYINPSKIMYNPQQMALWAKDLQEIAHFFAKRGQKFIYLITPSKATFYPEFLPDSYAKILTNPRPDYFLKMNALNKTDITYFDASQFILTHKDKSYNNLLFTRGGTHWTMLSAGLVAQQLINIISQQTNTSLPSLSFTYNISKKPLGVDKDLLHLAKLLFPPKHYIVPRVTFIVNEHPVPLKLALIGGSFTHFFKELFAESHYFTQLDHYYYLVLNHYRISQKGIKTEIAMNRYDPASYHDILNADVVILEENEILPYSNHFRELYYRLLGKYPSS